MGLRRAFATAGAEALVMSLWQVPDRSTRELMTAFYESYLASGDAALAMTQAQRAALGEQRRAGEANPWHWGAFVVCRAARR